MVIARCMHTEVGPQEAQEAQEAHRAREEQMTQQLAHQMAWAMAQQNYSQQIGRQED
jgi:hypothetical protein